MKNYFSVFPVFSEPIYWVTVLWQLIINYTPTILLRNAHEKSQLIILLFPVRKNQNYP